MKGIESARHDLGDAGLSIDTAIDLLSSIERDGRIEPDELRQVISRLVELKGGLEETYHRLHGFENIYDA